MSSPSPTSLFGADSGTSIVTAGGIFGVAPLFPPAPAPAPAQAAPAQAAPAPAPALAFVPTPVVDGVKTEALYHGDVTYRDTTASTPRCVSGRVVVARVEHGFKIVLLNPAGVAQMKFDLHPETKIMCTEMGEAAALCVSIPATFCHGSADLELHFGQARYFEMWTVAASLVNARAIIQAKKNGEQHALDILLEDIRIRK